MAATDVPTASAERPAEPLAWLSLTLAAVAVSAGLAGLALGLTPSPDTVTVRQNLLGTAATFVLVMSFTLVGLILRRSRAENRVGWVLLAFGVAVAVASLGWSLTYVGGLPGGDAALGRNAAWLGSVLTFPIWTYLAVALIVRFPSGALGSRFDVRLLQAAAAISILAAGLAAVRPGTFPIYPSFSNPIELPPPLGDLVTGASGASFLLALVPMTIAAWNMVVRYRHASTVERAQLRWFAYAAALAFSGAALYVTVGVLAARDNEVLRESTYVVLILAICSQPIAILQAITRHRLYDIDTIISRTFAYGALTAILAGLYAASMRLFNAAFVAVTGQESEAALVLTTLVLATTFTPIKNRLEAIAAKRLRPAGGARGSTDAPAGADAAAGAGPPIAGPQLEALVRRVVDEALRERDATTPS